MSVNNAPRGPLTVFGDEDGKADIGANLLARPNGISDADGIDLNSIAFEWTRDGEAIPGATDNRYTVTEADKGANLVLRYSYTDLKGTRETVEAKPIQITSPFREWLDATYQLLLGRDADPVGVRVYGNAYRNGVDGDLIYAYIKADKARGAK